MVAGTALLEVRRNGVDVARLRAERNVDAGAARGVDQALQQEMRALGAVDLENRVQRVEPFLGFGGVDIVLVGLPVALNRRFGLVAPLFGLAAYLLVELAFVQPLVAEGAELVVSVLVDVPDWLVSAV
jgi:hypothetical protein